MDKEYKKHLTKLLERVNEDIKKGNFEKPEFDLTSHKTIWGYLCTHPGLGLDDAAYWCELEDKGFLFDNPACNAVFTYVDRFEEYTGNYDWSDRVCNALCPLRWPNAAQGIELVKPTFTKAKGVPLDTKPCAQTSIRTLSYCGMCDETMVGANGLLKQWDDYTFMCNDLSFSDKVRAECREAASKLARRIKNLHLNPIVEKLYKIV